MKRPLLRRLTRPGKDHVDAGGDVTKVLQFTEPSAEKIDATGTASGGIRSRGLSVRRGSRGVGHPPKRLAAGSLEVYIPTPQVGRPCGQVTEFGDMAVPFARSIHSFR